MNRSLTLAILLVTALTAVTAGDGHDSTWGKRTSNDFLYRTEYVRENASSNRQVSKDYSFEQTGDQRTITQIVVTDLYALGKGGYATLVSGGPNYTFAKLHFTSQTDFGLSFLIQIYVK